MLHLLVLLIEIFYSRFLFPVLSPIQSLRGTWYYIIRIEKPAKGIRHGEVCITNELGALTFTAASLDEDNVFRSSFHSLATYLDHAQLLVFYQSEGHTRKINRITNGMMELTLSERRGRFQKPQTMQGSWKDTVPSAHSGSIVFYSNKVEYMEELKKEIEQLRIG